MADIDGDLRADAGSLCTLINGRQVLRNHLDTLKTSIKRHLENGNIEDEKRKSTIATSKLYRNSNAPGKCNSAGKDKIIKKCNGLLNIDCCFQKEKLHTKYYPTSRKCCSIGKSTVSERSVDQRNVGESSKRSGGGKNECNDNQYTFTIKKICRPETCPQHRPKNISIANVTDKLKTVKCNCDSGQDLKDDPPIKLSNFKCKRCDDSTSDPDFCSDSTTDPAKLTNSSHLSTKSQSKRSTSGSSPVEDDSETLKPITKRKSGSQSSPRNTSSRSNSIVEPIKEERKSTENIDPASKAQSNYSFPKAKSGKISSKAQSAKVSSDEDGLRTPKASSFSKIISSDTKPKPIAKDNPKEKNLKENTNENTKTEEKTAPNNCDDDKENNETKEQNNNCCWAPRCPNPCGCCCTRFCPMRCMCACQRCMMRPSCNGPCCSCSCRPPPKCCCSRNR